MEKKLAEYRAKKEREEQIIQYKGKIKTFFNKYFSSNMKEKVEEKVLIDDDQIDEIASDEEIVEETTSEWSYLDIISYVLWFVLWATVYVIFIKLEFGMVYLLISMIVFIFLNTRSGPKRKNEISAYSVFNKDCHSIDGTLKAEQFEREIRYGSGSVK